MLTKGQADELEITPRRALIVWVYSLKQLKNLRRFGYVHHVSKKMKYVVLYVNDDEIDDMITKLDKLYFVRSIDKSARPDINMNFNNRLGNKELTNDKVVEFEEQNTEIVLANFEEESYHLEIKND